MAPKTMRASQTSAMEVEHGYDYGDYHYDDDEYYNGATSSNRDRPTRTSTPVDLDDLFDEDFVEDEDEGLFSESEMVDDDADNAAMDLDRIYGGSTDPRYFNDPNKRLLDNDASLIPGSPFSKPANRFSNRPTEPLAIARHASSLGFLLALGWVAYLLFSAIWNYASVGRIIVEVILALFSFFGLFWNSYFIVSSIMKCFIPTKAFQTNTKYCSIIPEKAPPDTAWLDVTIQIPVYKESLKDVIMPTLQSCMKARDHYIRNSKAKCNIVVCDDGMMAFLRDNFPAAEMLWNGIVQTKGRKIKLSQVLRVVPRASRRHLKGLRSKDVYEVFHRMVFYYHFDIGFVARSTIDRRGKFKKASNLNSHLRLALGASQIAKDNSEISFDEALMEESHNDDGSRYVMFGNNIRLGHLIVVNDADARMAESVIIKTVPEFLNDATLGFTQHSTKTMTEQRNDSYFTKMLSVYTDALYQGHFLLSSILGCPPPLVGHSIFLRTEALKQCGRMRTLRKAQKWLQNIGLPFLPVDQIGFGNLQAQNRTEYWSESHVSEDFELMIHLYNLGFNGRYVAYPDVEFQEGITRTFDEEAGRHRKFALGAHELVFNSFADMVGQGIFTPMFRTFLTCHIPSYYKIFLAAYLCSYSSGGTYLIIFGASAIARIVSADPADAGSLAAFSPAGIIIFNFAVYYVLGYATFLITLIRMNRANPKLLFGEYRKQCCGACYLVFVKLRYCLVFQFLFYSVATFTFYLLGSIDHLFSRPGVVGATNKDVIYMGRCKALWNTIWFNSGSWIIALLLAGLAYTTVLADEGWDPTSLPQDILKHALFAAPALFIALMTWIVPLALNPYIWGWPFVKQGNPISTTKTGQSAKGTASGKPLQKSRQSNNNTTRGGKTTSHSANSTVVDIHTFMTSAESIQQEMERVQGRPDVELGSLSTKDLRSHASSPVVTSTSRKTQERSMMEREREYARIAAAQKQQVGGGSSKRMYSIPELENTRPTVRNTSGTDPRRSSTRNNTTNDNSRRTFTSFLYDV